MSVPPPFGSRCTVPRQAAPRRGSAAAHLTLAALCVLASAIPAAAQMVPVADDSTASLPVSPDEKLYTTPTSPPTSTDQPPTATLAPAADAPLARPAAITATDPGLPAIAADPLPKDAAPSASAGASPNPTTPPAVLAATPAAATHIPVPALAPVTLPPKPKPVRDLPPIPSGDTPRVRPFRAVAFGLTASTLGPGVEMAIPIARTLNVRVGAGYVNWNYPFLADGIHYNPALKFTSGRGTIDWFPHHGGFHVSAGALYFRNTVAGSAAALVGTQFTLGDTTYTNSIDDPVSGNASLNYGRQIAPLLTLGFGNILPRSGRHISVPIEFGGAWMGQPPTLNLHLTGTACTTQGCFSTSSATVQTNLKAEVQKLQDDVRFLQVYPIVSIGLACRF